MRPGRDDASATTSSTRAPRSCAACRTAAATRSDGCYDRTATGSRAPTSSTSRPTSPTQKTGKPIFQPYGSGRSNGVKVGFIGVTLEGTPNIVTPSGVDGPEVRRRGRDGQQVRRGAAAPGRQVDRRADPRGRRAAAPDSAAQNVNDCDSLERRRISADRHTRHVTPRSTSWSPATPTRRTTADDRRQARHQRRVVRPAGHGHRPDRYDRRTGARASAPSAENVTGHPRRRRRTPT